MRKSFSIVAALPIFFAAAIFPHASARAEGFGITPPYVNNNALTQNSHYDQQILLVRGDPVQDLKATISVNVPGANEWISIDKGSEFTLPAGTQQVPITVSVNVPDNAKLGHYAGNIQVVVSPLNLPAQGTVGVRIGAQINVNLQVIDRRMADFKLRRVTMTNTEEGHSFWWMHFPGKILFTMDLENVGNVAAPPRKVVFQYREYLSDKVLESEENTNRLDSVKPFDARQVVAEMPTYLPRGTYKVFYQIYGRDDGDMIGQGSLDLSVLPPGTLTAYQGYGFWGIRIQEKLTTFGVIFLVLFALYFLGIGAKKLFRRGRGKRFNRVMAPPPPPPRRY